MTQNQVQLIDAILDSIGLESLTSPEPKVRTSILKI